MKLADLIDRLVEIHNKEEDYNPVVSIMHEYQTDDGVERQHQSEIRDVANSNRSGVIIIGQELD